MEDSELISSLTIIKGYSELLMRTKQTEEDIINFSKIIFEEATSLEEKLSNNQSENEKLV
ncbi:hypothetical protein [Enterococcus sp. BWR-S5]|uniref:hypothetical protein n=1 Tax=Enterococcus sp. BWR-S5 TaxID=2787714 RepID=UPI001921CD9E|nr:hypothetical protein [Enterococcus sp. BWR-S5]MBL1226617.1 hypothetical protein [Enterococcus sp. BWR-S5]